MATKKNNTGTKRKTGGAKKTSAAAGRAENGGAPGISMRSEAAVLFLFAFSALLLLSNFGLCGTLGAFLKQLQTGLFGLLGYLFPFFLIVSGVYGIANRWSMRVVVKISSVLLSGIVFSALIHLLFGEKGTDAGWKTLYEAGHAGGLLGGGLSLLFQSVLGKAGSFLILTVFLILLLVLVTERSFVGAVRSGGGKAYRHAKDDFGAFREERRARLEERRRAIAVRENGRNIDLGSTDLYREEPSEEAGEEAEDTALYAAGDSVKEPDGEPSSEAAWEPSPETSWQPSPEPAWTPDPVPAPVTSREAAASQQAFPDIPKIIQTPPVFADEDPFLKDAFSRADEILRTAAPSSVFISGVDAGNPSHGTIPAGTVPVEREHAAPVREEVPYPIREEIPVEEKAPFQEDTFAAADVPAPADAPVQEDSDSFPSTELNFSAPEEIRSGEAPEGSDSTEVSSAVTGEPAGAETPVPDSFGTPEPVWSDEDYELPEERQVVTANGQIIPSEMDVVRERMKNRSRYGMRPEGGEEERVSVAVRTTHIPRDYREGTAEALNRNAEENAPAVRPAEPVEKKEYQFPPLSLLNQGDSRAIGASREQCARTAQRLEQTLHSFGVEVKVTNFSCGPRVTRYELQPAPGVKVNSILALSDDIKLSLAAADIRIEAPIPGKSAVGIEVPNPESQTVYLRELLESQSFRGSRAKIAFAVGKDIGGQTVVADIAKMPHVLIAGATGSGKSVCINTLIMSILYRYKPEEVKLIMVDPKVVELSVYNGIPHLLIPVVTDPKKASAALDWAVREMEDRYRKFTTVGVKELSRYNEKIREAQQSGTVSAEELPEPMPQIVIIIDELADLMMTCKSDVEAAICRLAQLARAAGMHLVIATQRPSVNVITGLIKANVPSRIAFAVSSGVDSRTILDGNGAEKLLGYGDMLFAPQSAPRPLRVQGALISDQEVQKVVDFIKEEAIPLSYSTETAEQITRGAEGMGQTAGDRRDDLFSQAGFYIIDKKKASIGNLQRAFKIGFNRAARIMDQLAEAGVVGEEQGTKPREILMTPEQFEELMQQ